MDMVINRILYIILVDSRLELYCTLYIHSHHTYYNNIFHNNIPSDSTVTYFGELYEDTIIFMKKNVIININSL